MPNCYRFLDLIWQDNILAKPRSKMTTVSCFSRQNDAGLRALNVAPWESLVLGVVLVLGSKGPKGKRRDTQGTRLTRIRWGCAKVHSIRVADILWCKCPLVSLGTFRSDYDYEYEYEFFNVYLVRMPDCVRLSRQLVLSSKSRRRLHTNYEIVNKSRPPTTSSLQVQSRVKRLVLKRADTLWNVPCNLSRNVLATLWHLLLFVY